MEGIYETNAKFPFDKLTLTPPTVLSGGNHFIKYLVDGSPLYIQPPKCKTKGGIAKSGKRMHCDLVFTNENEDFIRWMEDLETHTCKYIYENRAKWFETEMELHDVENYFSSPLKIYKSGKFYLARTNINTRLGKMSLKIYDENEQDVDPDTIGENTQIVTILEIQGIKCSARSFQVEIEAKQMMVVQPTNLFERCILGRGRSDDKPSQAISSNLENSGDVAAESYQMSELQNTNIIPDVECMEIQNKGIEAGTNSEDGTSDIDVSVQNTVSIEDPVCKHENESFAEPSSEDFSQPLHLNNPKSLEEFEVELYLDEVNSDEMVQIKARNEVYYKMYRDARKKAKLARSMALSAYLEAKQIKNTYFLDNADESEESDMDEEFFIRNTSDQNKNAAE